MRKIILKSIKSLINEDRFFDVHKQAIAVYDEIVKHVNYVSELAEEAYWYDYNSPQWNRIVKSDRVIKFYFNMEPFNLYGNKRIEPFKIYSIDNPFHLEFTFEGMKKSTGALYKGRVDWMGDWGDEIPTISVNVRSFEHLTSRARIEKLSSMVKYFRSSLIHEIVHMIDDNRTKGKFRTDYAKNIHGKQEKPDFDPKAKLDRYYKHGAERHTAKHESVYNVLYGIADKYNKLLDWWQSLPDETRERKPFVLEVRRQHWAEPLMSYESFLDASISYLEDRWSHDIHINKYMTKQVRPQVYERMKKRLRSDLVDTWKHYNERFMDSIKHTETFNI